LISVSPNATKRLQKLEVAAFRLLKLDWKRAVLDWQRENYDKILNKEKFAPVLDGALKKCYVDC
jgi:hypothetical protein